MSGTNLRAQFPSGPMLDASGEIMPVWRAYFASLYVRTGGAAGASSDTTQLQADLDAEEVARQNADAALTLGLVAERSAREIADSAEAAARAAADAGLLPLAGGTMTGNIILAPGTPTLPRQAVSKSYVDGAAVAQRNTNLADNSGFSVNQRTYVSGTARTVGIYAHDRWKAGASGCTYTFAQSPGPSTTITITAGSLQQVIEGASLVGGNYVLSWIGTAQGRIGGGAYAASPVAVAGIVAGTDTTVEFNTGSLGQVKFEAGAVVTSWVARTAADELANCQRFYQVPHFWLASYHTAGATVGYGVPFVVQMRAVPTLVPTFTTNINITGPAAAIDTNVGVVIYGAATATGGILMSGYVNASADL
jgi:hypothetical protein